MNTVQPCNFNFNLINTQKDLAELYLQCYLLYVIAIDEQVDSCIRGVTCFRPHLQGTVSYARTVLV